MSLAPSDAQLIKNEPKNTKKKASKCPAAKAQPEGPFVLCCSSPTPCPAPSWKEGVPLLKELMETGLGKQCHFQVDAQRTQPFCVL